MGYKFQFITLAGIHSNWYNMFNLAHGYARNQGMKRLCGMVQEAEFAARERGYTFVSHQQEVGTGYFDDGDHHHRSQRVHGRPQGFDGRRPVLRRKESRLNPAKRG
jgi:isocitrate lyase